MSTLPKKESISVEFKTSFSDNVIETLVAFSNAKGGTVYVGVTDEGKAQGITLGKETIQSLINEIKSKTNPQIIPDVDVLEIKNKTILLLYAPEYPIKPVSIKGKFYKRAGDSNHLLGVDEIANEHLKTINSSWDMFPDVIHSLEEISLSKVQKCIKLMKNNGISVKETNISFLEKYNLIKDNKITNAAFLMFKKNNEVTTTIELGRFQDDITIKDSDRTKSDILTQIDEVLNFVKKHINLEIIITGEPRNIQRWQYPMEAIREIVLNMIIHRDYRSSSDSIVKVFDDRIEFYNPGRLPDNITVDDLLSNNYRSTPRNKKIAETFKDMGLIEKYGSGIRRIIDYFKDENRRLPQFTNISDGFMVTVFVDDNKAKSMKKYTEKGTEKGTEKLTKNQQMILDYITSNPQITIVELTSTVNISASKIKENISKLKIKGYLKRIGPDKGGYWEIIK